MIQDTQENYKSNRSGGKGGVGKTAHGSGDVKAAARYSDRVLNLIDADPAVGLATRLAGGCTDD